MINEPDLAARQALSRVVELIPGEHYIVFAGHGEAFPGEDVIEELRILAYAQRGKGTLGSGIAQTIETLAEAVGTGIITNVLWEECQEAKRFADKLRSHRRRARVRDAEEAAQRALEAVRAPQIPVAALAATDITVSGTGMDGTTWKISCETSGKQVDWHMDVSGTVIDVMISQRPQHRPAEDHNGAGAHRARPSAGTGTETNIVYATQETFGAETREESELFARALSAAAATAVAAHYSQEQAERYIRQHQEPIWQSVASQRHRARQAAAPVRAAEQLVESAFLRDEPRLAALRYEARQHESQMLERSPRFHSVAEEVRLVRNRDPQLTPDGARWIDGLIAEMAEEIQEHAAWLAQIRGRQSPGLSSSDADLPGGRMPPDPGRRSWYRGRKAPASFDAEERYQKLLETLLKFRHTLVYVATERRRAEKIVSDEVQRIANQVPRFPAARRAMEAASADLLTALLHDAMIPQIRVFIGSGSPR